MVKNGLAKNTYNVIAFGNNVGRSFGNLVISFPLNLLKCNKDSCMTFMEFSAVLFIRDLIGSEIKRQLWIIGSENRCKSWQRNIKEDNETMNFLYEGNRRPTYLKLYVTACNKLYIVISLVYELATQIRDSNNLNFMSLVYQLGMKKQARIMEVRFESKMSRVISTANCQQFQDHMTSWSGNSSSLSLNIRSTVLLNFKWGYMDAENNKSDDHLNLFAALSSSLAELKTLFPQRFEGFVDSCSLIKSEAIL